MEENGSLVQFIFNQDREVIAEQNSIGVTRYIRNSELIARNTDAARTYYHYVSDEIGSTTHIVDEDGIVLNRYELIQISVKKKSPIASSSLASSLTQSPSSITCVHASTIWSSPTLPRRTPTAAMG